FKDCFRETRKPTRGTRALPGQGRGQRAEDRGQLTGNRSYAKVVAASLTGIKLRSEFRQTAGAFGLRRSARRHISLFFPLPPAGRHTLSTSRSYRPDPRR